MKTMLWHYKILLLALMVSPFAQGQNYERSRSVQKTFYAPPSAEIQIINKYGDIHLVPWDKDSVKFDIQLSVTSNKEAKIDKIFDYIDFEFQETSYYIIGQTVFKGQNTFWTEVSDMASLVFSGGTHTQIDYTVYFPENSDVKIENKFGNLYTTDHPGKVDFFLSNGDLKAHSFTGPATIRIDFGNATIDQVNAATFNVNYSELYLEQASEIIVESKSSRIFLTNCDVIQMDSKRDKYYISKAAEVSGNSYFSNLNFDLLTTRITLKSNYGDIKVQDVGPSFSHMEFGSENTNITLYIGREFYYDIDITRDDRTQMVFTATMLTRNESTLNPEKTSFRLRCTAGTAGKQTIPVNINAKSGKIFLMNL